MNRNDIYKKPQTKYTLLGSFFLVYLCLFALLAIVLPDKDISDRERRHLQTLPAFSVENILNGNYFSKMDSYLLDHFPMRDTYRTSKNSFDLTVLQKSDADGYFQVDDSLYELPETIHTENVAKTLSGFQSIMDKYFVSSQGYYCVIPDKTYYLSKDSGYPRAQYDDFMHFTAETLESSLTKIDISATLSLEHYYHTDMHLRQEMIADSLLGESYDEILMSDTFYGGISSASGIYPTPDKLIGITTPTICDAIVYDYETQSEIPLYTTDKISGLDPYDVYLGGPKALLKLHVPNKASGKELVLFRDSFGSSIAPLLLDYYDTIYLVDLRYTTVDTAMSLITPETGCDVLFLYSMNVLNSGSLRTKVI